MHSAHSAPHSPSITFAVKQSQLHLVHTAANRSSDGASIPIHKIAQLITLLLTDWFVISQCIEQFDLLVDRPLLLAVRRVFAGALHFRTRAFGLMGWMDGEDEVMWPPAIGVMIDNRKLRNSTINLIVFKKFVYALRLILQQGILK